MANDQNGNDSNRADKAATRVDSQWSGMVNITKHYSTGEGVGAEARLIGAFREKGEDSICQPWDNSGAVYTIVYRWNDNLKGMKPLIHGGNNTGERSDAKAWLVGDFDGNGKDEICQMWSTDTERIQMVVYTLMNQQMVVLGSAGNTLYTYLEAPWLVGNVCHVRAAKQNICQPWDGGDALGFTIWEWTADTNDQSSGQMEVIWYGQLKGRYQPNTWLIGDINGDGLAEIIQVWNDDRVAMSVYGWVEADDDDGEMKVLWSGDISTEEGADALAWLIGDVDGDGKAEIIQMYDNQGLASIVYAWRDGSGMVEIGKNTNLGGDSNALSWQVGDFNGDGKIEVCQIWKNTGGNLGMTVYAWGGSKLQEIWYNSNMGVVADFESILIGNVTGGLGDNICQLINNNGGLDIVVYGSGSS
jgi:hypothetical protein